jgi:hypothetical protein
VWLPIWICPESTMGRSAGALTDHELLTPLTKNVSQTPLGKGAADGQARP